jgi:NADH-quinone oxidoreductase subunit I
MASAGSNRYADMCRDTVVLQQPRPRYVIAFLKGLWVTIRHFLKRFPARKSNRVCIQYPEEKRDYSGRFRGVHILTKRESGDPKCVACYMCATICPAECIHIVAGEHPDPEVEKYPEVFEIDMLRCVLCGFCVEACPEEAIIMSKELELHYETREESVFGKERLMDRAYLKENPEDLGYRPYYGEKPTEIHWKK